MNWPVGINFFNNKSFTNNTGDPFHVSGGFFSDGMGDGLNSRIGIEFRRIMKRGTFVSTELRAVFFNQVFYPDNGTPYEGYEVDTEGLGVSFRIGTNLIRSPWGFLNKNWSGEKSLLGALYGAVGIDLDAKPFAIYDRGFPDKSDLNNYVNLDNQFAGILYNSNFSYALLTELGYTNTIVEFGWTFYVQYYFYGSGNLNMRNYPLAGVRINMNFDKLRKSKIYR